MAQGNKLHALLPSMAFFALFLLACASIASFPRTTASAAVRTPKCTIDIADGKESDCTLVKAKDEWILWMNSGSVPRSIHFKSDDNPFTEKTCWDVTAGARERSGPVALNTALKTYNSYTSDAPCGSNPPSSASRGISNVTVQ